MSLYEYVGGMPLGAMDPWGLERVDEFSIVDEFRAERAAAARWAAPLVEGFGYALITPAVILTPGPEDLILIGVLAGAAKGAVILRNYRLGMLAEGEVVAQLTKAGYIIVGRHVRVMTAYGPRVIDIVVKVGDEYWGIEVKANKARRRASQVEMDSWINKHGAFPKGKASEKATDGMPVKGTQTINWDCNG